MEISQNFRRLTSIRLPHISRSQTSFFPALYSGVPGGCERMHDGFNEFSSHPWHILCGWNLLIIHDFLVIVIIPLFHKLDANEKEKTLL